MSKLQSTMRAPAQEGEDSDPDDRNASPQPGLILIFSVDKPRFSLLPLADGWIEVGRGDSESVWPADPRMSRRHARVHYDGRQFQVEDLGSQNGCFVDGIAVKPRLTSDTACVLRTGDSLFLLCPDLRPYRRAEGITVSADRVVGPILRTLLAQVRHFASFSPTLHITGESGVGKEGAAQSFHAAGPNPSGPFVAVNCATIPQSVAERVLFGAKRGAFSGAVADTDGYIQAADGGTLFLDEIAELDLAVQAKLLRVLETHEVCQLGSTRPRSVKMLVCSASNKDLRVEVGAGRFREDLYFRLNRPAIELPALRQRKEEVPWLIDLEMKRISGGPVAQVSFVEACLLRFWPGNVREFLTEVRAAGHLTLAEAKRAVSARHLTASAGQPFVAEPPAEHIALCPQGGITSSREVIEKVLRRTAGNVSAAARLLNLHRTQLKRNLDRLGIDPTRFSSEPPSQED